VAPTTRCAIVGSGIAALAGYATLRHGGVRPEEITVLGTHEDPTAAWRVRAEAIRQQRMRSESDGHLAAASFPGLAVREAWRELALKPLLQTATSRYHPRVEDFLRHANRVVATSGWEQSFVTRRIDRIRAVDGGFELDGEGPFAHVLVAPGHPGLSRPDEFPDAVHAYELHEYAPKVAVIGAGMAAATEWLNALAAGSEVVSIRRREPLRRPLNVPRPLFSQRGLASFHALTDERRAATLRELTAPSYPVGAAWDRALQTDRFHSVKLNGDRFTDYQVIAATGFKAGFEHDRLLTDLVAEHDLPAHDRWIVLEPDSTVAALTDDARTLSIAGVAGQWAFPAADTIAGAKYAARAFLRSLCRTR
jgi:cation diffusion facilitator CzcD-associated flavoprotein CzcO